MSTASWFEAIGGLFKSDFAKSPAGGIVLGVIMLLIKGWYDRRSARLTLLSALAAETRTLWQPLQNLAESFPKRAEVDALVEGIESGTLTFEQLDALPAGWVFFAPSFPLSDIIAKLRPKEADLAISYFDAWSRVTDFERRFSQDYAKLIDLTPKIGDPASEMQLKEVAIQVRGNLRQLIAAADQVAICRHKLQVLAERNWWHPWKKQPIMDSLSFPSDWASLKQESSRIEEPAILDETPTEQEEDGGKAQQGSQDTP